MKPLLLALVALAAVAPALPGIASEPWVITSPVEVTEPRDVGDVIVASGGRLVVHAVPRTTTLTSHPCTSSCVDLAVPGPFPSQKGLPSNVLGEL